MGKSIITKEIVGNTLYVRSNGYTIYKKWLDTGQSKMFHENEGLTMKVIEYNNRKTKYK